MTVDSKDYTACIIVKITVGTWSYRFHLSNIVLENRLYISLFKYVHTYRKYIILWSEHSERLIR